MSVNYIEAKNYQVLKRHTDTACYSKVFSDRLEKDANQIFFYEPGLEVDIDLCKWWVKEINGLGFKCKYLGKNLNKKYADLKIPKDYHVFYIDVTKYQDKNHLASTMTMLRYLYENPLEKYIRKYKEYRDKHPKLNRFNLLQMSFAQNTHSGNGHTLHLESNSCFYSKKELFNNFAKYKQDVYAYGRTNLHNCWVGKVLLPKSRFKKDNSLLMYKYMNKEERSIYVVGGSVNYANWLTGFKTTNSLKKADLVMFTGGEDVHPSLYNEPINPRTYTNLKRDLEEKKIYDEAKALGIPMIGICRGSQFLCVMNGGKLVQHQNNPSYIHDIKLAYGYGFDNIKMTSTHHQAAYPFNLNKYSYRILGWTEGISKFHLDGNDDELNPPQECEIVLYKDTRCLGIQGHPEDEAFQKENPNTIKALNAMVEEILN